MTATIVHLSDLHFGTERAELVDGLVARLRDLRPDLVAVSGDLTQRARPAQFAAAGAFLERLRGEGWQTLCVPGNHDMPLWRTGRRSLDPLDEYRRTIDRELCPSWRHAHVAVQGLNSARRFTGKNGRISDEQLALVERAFADAGPGVLRAVVVHHPLVELPWGPGGAPLPAVRRGDEALDAFTAAGVHVVLSGHHHRMHAGEAVAVRTTDRSLLVVQAGTATSGRTREEPNGFNVLRVGMPRLEVQAEAWTGDRFAPAGAAHAFARREMRWRRDAAPVDA